MRLIPRDGWIIPSMIITITRVQHAAEVMQHPDFPALAQEYISESWPYGTPANPRIDAYEQLLREKKIAALKATDNEGHLLGFVSIALGFFYHADSPTATIEGIFVTKEARKKCVSALLMKRAKALAREYGAAFLFLSALPGTAADRVFAKRFQCVAHLYLCPL